jgi:hypothetical protein
MITKKKEQNNMEEYDLYGGCGEVPDWFEDQYYCATGLRDYKIHECARGSETVDIINNIPEFKTYHEFKSYINKRMYMEAHSKSYSCSDTELYTGSKTNYFLNGELYIAWTIEYVGSCISEEFWNPTLLFPEIYGMSHSDADMLDEYDTEHYFFFLFKPPGEYVLTSNKYTTEFKKKFLFKSFGL